MNKMKKFALISLRNDYLSDRNESRDSIDTEIYKLVIQIGFIPVLLPNETIILNYLDKVFKEENIGLVLFTGGNDIYKFEKNIGSNTYKKRDEIEINLINYCKEKSIPILSICRGFQLIADNLGANIEEIKNHINTNHEIKFIQSKEKILVNSFHGYGLLNKNLPPHIIPLAIYEIDNSIEAFTTNDPFLSLNIMWHPERKNGSKNKTKALIDKFLFK